MKRYLVGVLVALLLGASLAVELPEDSTVVVRDGAGLVVGYGEFRDGTLELDVADGVAGFLTLVVTSEEGIEVFVEVMLSGDGTVVTDFVVESEISFVTSEEIAEEVAELEADAAEEAAEAAEEAADEEDGGDEEDDDVESEVDDDFEDEEDLEDED